jgi:hypothetical protein
MTLAHPEFLPVHCNRPPQARGRFKHRALLDESPTCRNALRHLPGTRSCTQDAGSVRADGPLGLRGGASGIRAGRPCRWRCPRALDRRRLRRRTGVLRLDPAGFPAAPAAPRRAASARPVGAVTSRRRHARCAPPGPSPGGRRLTSLGRPRLVRCGRTGRMLCGAQCTGLAGHTRAGGGACGTDAGWVCRDPTGPERGGRAPCGPRDVPRGVPRGVPRDVRHRRK